MQHKEKEKETFGELLTAREVQRYLCGSGKGKGSVIGLKRTRVLMRNQVIKSMYMKGRCISRKRDVDKFLENIATQGCADLSIQVPNRYKTKPQIIL